METTISQINFFEDELRVTVMARIPGPQGLVDVSIAVTLPRENYRLSDIELYALNEASRVLGLCEEDGDGAVEAPHQVAGRG